MFTPRHSQYLSPTPKVAAMHQFIEARQGMSLQFAEPISPRKNLIDLAILNKLVEKINQLK